MTTMKPLLLLSLGVLFVAACAGDPPLGQDGGGGSGGGRGGSGGGSAGSGGGGGAGGGTGGTAGGGSGGAGGGGAIDGGSKDLGPDFASGSGTPPGMCATYAFPSFDKSCAAHADCIVELHTISCCGTRVAWGVNVSQKAAFEAAEKACDAAYPGCGCPTAATTDEEGTPSKTFDGTDIVASCVSGVCRSFVK